MWKEFKAFAFKGNVLELAIAVIMGGAFGKIVSSIVDDLIMPLIGILLAGRNFSDLAITYQDAVITYGAFIQSVVDFVIIAVSIFIFIKLINRMKKKQEEEVAEAPAEPSNEEKLLTEIRDLLKNPKQ